MSSAKAWMAPVDSKANPVKKRTLSVRDLLLAAPLLPIPPLPDQAKDGQVLPACSPY